MNTNKQYVELYSRDNTNNRITEIKIQIIEQRKWTGINEERLEGL